MRCHWTFRLLRSRSIWGKKQSPLLTRDCLHQQPGAHWPADEPRMRPARSPRAALSQPRGSDPAVCALLARGSAHGGTAPLIPKCEKLSPVQLSGADGSSLTGTTLHLPRGASTPFPATASTCSPGALGGVQTLTLSMLLSRLAPTDRFKGWWTVAIN